MDPQNPHAVRLKLPPVLDVRSAGPLCERLRAVRGTGLKLDASEVERLGGLCLQVLISARKTWQADGKAFAVLAASDAFSAALKLSGAEPLFVPELASSCPAAA